MQPRRFGPGTAAAALAAAALLPAAATPAAAQEDVARRSFAFFDRNLTVEIVADAPGVLHVVRAGRSRIDVAANAENGVAAFGLGGPRGDHLRLAAAGTGNVEYVVTVPENVQLHVHLPDRGYPVLADGGASAIYRWDVAASPASLGGHPDVAPTYMAATAPREIVFADRAALRRLAFRIQPGQFRIDTSRPLQLTPGRSDVIEIRTPGEIMDFVIHVPEATRDFTVRVGPDIVLSIRQGVVSAPCSPATQQMLADGRRWIDYSPQGAWRCGA